MRPYRLTILHLLPAFEATARHQSMKKAAAELNLSRTAISHQVVKLEHHVGRRLFHRLPKALLLTEAGKILQSAVEVAFSHIQQAVTQLSGTPAPERLILSVDPDFAGLWLVPRLSEFYDSVPGTVVEIVAEKDVSPTHPVHCTIRFAPAGRIHEHGDLLFRSRLFPVYSTALARARPLRSPKDLCRHVLLHDRSMLEWQEYLSRCEVGTEVDAHKGIIFSKTTLCLEAAARGQGVAIGDDFLAAMYLAEGRLIKPFEFSLVSRNAYYFVVPPGAAKHPALAAFRSWLLHTVGGSRPGRSV